MPPVGGQRDHKPHLLKPMFKRTLKAAVDARAEMFLERRIHNRSDDPYELLHDVMQAEQVFQDVCAALLASVRTRIPSHLQPRHLENVALDESALLVAFGPVVDAFDKHVARAMWRKASCVVRFLVAFRQCVQRRYAPGGRGFKRARDEFASLVNPS